LSGHEIVNRVSPSLVEARPVSEDLGAEQLRPTIGVLAKGAGISLVGRLAGRGLGLVNQVLLARLLGPETFGLFALGWTVQQISRMVVPLGLDKAVIRFGARYWRREEHLLGSVLRQCIGVATLASVLVSLAIFLLAPHLASHVFGNPKVTLVFRAFALSIAAASVLRVTSEATRITQRMQFSVLSEELAPSIAQLLLIVLLVYALGWGLQGALLSVIVAFYLGLLTSFAFLKSLFPGWLRREHGGESLVSELVRFALPTSLAGVFTMLIMWVDRLFVGYFLGAADVGVYQAASQVTLVFAIVLTAFNVTFSPMIVRLYHDGRRRELDDLYKISTKWGLYLSLPLFLFVVFVPRDFLLGVFGPKYVRGAWPMVVLASAQLVNVGTGAVGLMLTMTGHQNRWLGLAVTSLLANAVLSVVLIPRFEILGAAVATGLTIIVLFVTALISVRFVLGFWPYDRRYVKGVGASVATALVLASVRQIMPDPLLLKLALLVLVAYGAFAATLWVLGLDDEDRGFLELVWGKMSGRLTSG